MQIKIFTIPIPDCEPANEELNKFLRSHKVLKVDDYVFSNEYGNFWCFSVQYAEGVGISERPKVDYKAILDESIFRIFSNLREVRKKLALEDGVPPFVVFTDEELAGIAKLGQPIALNDLKKVPGIGAKKVEKYGEKMLELLKNASS